jgi:hypothetical protein
MGIYLGHKAGEPSQVFRSATEPTRQSHGAVFDAVVGPFRTVRGAKYMRDHGCGNPHCRCVADAERLSKPKKR